MFVYFWQSCLDAFKVLKRTAGDFRFFNAIFRIQWVSHTPCVCNSRLPPEPRVNSYRHWYIEDEILPVYVLVLPCLGIVWISTSSFEQRTSHCNTLCSVEVRSYWHRAGGVNPPDWSHGDDLDGSWGHAILTFWWCYNSWYCCMLRWLSEASWNWWVNQHIVMLSLQCRSQGLPLLG